MVISRLFRLLRLAGPLALLFPALLLGGCFGGIFGGGEKPSPLMLVGFQSAQTHRPGDALVVELVMISHHNKPLLLPYLNSATVNFWITDETGRTFKRPAVSSPQEQTSAPEGLEPEERWRRRFVLTQATETTGTFRWQAIYGSALPVEGLLPTGPIASDPLTYIVRGPRQFQRDSDGVLLEGDALAVAREWAGLPQVEAAAQLVRNEAGFLEWWIRLDPGADGKFQKACLVNPYLGEVRAALDPTVVPPAGSVPQIKAPPPILPHQSMGNMQNR
jgi:hypothetical protein